MDLCMAPCVFLEKMDKALAEGVDALKLVLSKDFGESWRLFNVEQKYKHLRQHTIIAAWPNAL